MNAALLSFPPAIAAQLRDSGYRVLVTGASGWLGRAAVEMLSQALGPNWAARVHCFGSSARTLKLRHGIAAAQRPLAEMGTLPPQRSILLHFACLTREKASGMSQDDYAARNRAISRLAVEAAGKVGVERAFLTSSGAVYAAMAAPSADSDPAQLYGLLKLEDEALFKRFAEAAAGRRTLTVRLFNLSGPYVNKLYALASFIEQARHASAIDIHADHPVIRSYTGVENLLAVALAGLLETGGERHRCFDTAGEREVEVQDLAEAVRSIVNPDAVVRRASCKATGGDRYVGDATLYRALATRHEVPLHDLERQIRDTARYLVNGLAS